METQRNNQTTRTIWNEIEIANSRNVLLDDASFFDVSFRNDDASSIVVQLFDATTTTNYSNRLRRLAIAIRRVVVGVANESQIEIDYSRLAIRVDYATT